MRVQRIFHTWYSVWQSGLDLLPPDLVEVLNSVGVAYLLGMITSTIATIAGIRLYRRVMLGGSFVKPF